MTNDITTSSRATLTLEECDEAFTKGVFLIRDAVLNYAQHGLTGTEIGKRVRDLGAKLSDSQARRYIQSFRAEKLLPEKEKVQTPDAIRMRETRERRTNAQNAQTFEPQPSTLAPLDPTLNEELAPLAPSTTEMGRAMEAHLAATDDMTDQELQIARLEWERDMEHAGVETILRNFGHWDAKTGFEPDPPITLIEKHLDDLNIEELERLQADITRRINRATAINV